MKKILILSTTLILTIFFIGCGGGGSSFTSSSGTAVVTCTTNDASTNTTWSTLSSGQTVTVTTGIELLWKYTSNKQVCMKSSTGSATIN